MGWKNWSYWLKGGIIAVTLFIILSLVFGILGSQVSEGNNGPSPLLLIDFPGLWIDYFTFDILNSYPKPSYMKQLFTIGLYSAIFWFIIGAIIGFIVGKVKSR